MIYLEITKPEIKQGSRKESLKKFKLFIQGSHLTRLEKASKFVPVDKTFMFHLQADTMQVSLPSLLAHYMNGQKFCFNDYRNQLVQVLAE